MGVGVILEGRPGTWLRPWWRRWWWVGFRRAVLRRCIRRCYPRISVHERFTHVPSIVLRVVRALVVTAILLGVGVDDVLEGHNRRRREGFPLRGRLFFFATFLALFFFLSLLLVFILVLALALLHLLWPPPFHRCWCNWRRTCEHVAHLLFQCKCMCHIVEAGEAGRLLI
jgi:hypothetical protein